MKILHITKKYPDVPGGDAIVVANLEKLQVMTGNEVFILAHRCPEVVEKQNVEVFGLKIPAANLDKITVKRVISLFSLTFTGYRNLKRIRPDIIHSHSPDLGFAIALPARLFHIPVVNTCHGVSLTDKNISVLKRYAEKFFLKYSGFTRIITVDHASLVQLRKAGILNVEYIPNGVDLNFWKKPENMIREDGKKITFLFVGRLEEQKGLVFLIEAVRRLRRDLGEFTVQIVGDGSQKSYLEKLVNRYELGSFVTFSGRMDLKDLKKMYHTADIFVLPSVWEGMPLTLLEAWASSIPVIVTKVGAIPDICADRENAMTVEPEDVANLHDVMLTLSRSRELRDRLVRNGVSIVCRNYSWSSVAEKTLQIYNDVRRESNGKQME